MAVSPKRIPASSKVYVRAKVSAKISGVWKDPTADAVKLAFMVGSTAPTSGDWQTGSWETDATTTPTTYYARCLVGPGGTITLTAGTYEVWVQVTDSPEVPVLQAGPLTVV